FQERRLIAIDCENLVGGAVIHAQDAQQARRELDLAVGARPGDQVVVGASHISALESGLAWPGAQLKVRSGPDGADICLIEALDVEWVARRFDSVVLASGDGIFTEVVSALELSG